MASPDELLGEEYGGTPVSPGLVLSGYGRPQPPPAAPDTGRDNGMRLVREGEQQAQAARDEAWRRNWIARLIIGDQGRANLNQFLQRPDVGAATGLMPGPSGMGLGATIGPIGLRNLSKIAEYPEIAPTLRKFRAAQKKGANLQELHELAAKGLEGGPVASLYPDPLSGKPVGETSDLALNHGIENAIRQLEKKAVRFHGPSGAEDVRPDLAAGEFQGGVAQRGVNASDPNSIFFHPVLEQAYPGRFRDMTVEYRFMPRSSGYQPTGGLNIPIQGALDRRVPIDLMGRSRTPDELLRVIAHETGHLPEAGALERAGTIGHGGSPIMFAATSPEASRQAAGRMLSSNQLMQLGENIWRNTPTPQREPWFRMYVNMPGERRGNIASGMRNLSNEEIAAEPAIWHRETDPEIARAMSPRWREPDYFQAPPQVFLRDVEGPRANADLQQAILDTYGNWVRGFGPSPYYKPSPGRKGKANPQFDFDFGNPLQKKAE